MDEEAKTGREGWWVLRAQSGDREALHELLKSVQGPLYRYINSLVGERALAEDILREVFFRINRSERGFKLAFFAAAALETLFLAAFVLAADFSNRTHLLLLIATVGSYSVVVLGLLALGAYVNRAVLRVLKAVELRKG